VPVDRRQRTGRQRCAASVGEIGANRSRASGETCLKKIPQPSEFNDLLSRQNSGDQFTLRGGVDLIEMQLRYRLRRELPYAFVKRALSNEVGHGAADTLIIERRPFPENSGSIKFDLSVSVSHASALLSEHGPRLRFWACEAGTVPGHGPARTT